MAVTNRRTRSHGCVPTLYGSSSAATAIIDPVILSGSNRLEIRWSLYSCACYDDKLKTFARSFKIHADTSITIRLTRSACHQSAFLHRRHSACFCPDTPTIPLSIVTPALNVAVCQVSLSGAKFWASVSICRSRFWNLNLQPFAIKRTDTPRYMQ